MFQDITIEEMLELQKKQQLTLIDVRSPGEFHDFTIPGSINIPLFDNEERKEIGTLYKQVSIQAAKEKGLEIVSRKLPAFVKRFEQIPERKAVYCWRGGMRSKTTATILSLMNIRVYRLTGGIRHYRRWVLEQLAHFRLNPQCIVINGYTGTGKTKMLQILERDGYPVLDLERLARHRGSIFGQIGLSPNNQKTFESLLVHELLRLNDQPFLLMEAESKRVGKVTLPDFLMEDKEKGMQLFFDMPAAERVRNIIVDYQPEQHKQECLEAFSFIEKRIHTPIAAEIRRHLQENRFSAAVELLLLHYYDCRYEHTTRQYQAAPIVHQVEHIEQAVEIIKKTVDPLRPQRNNNLSRVP